MRRAFALGSVIAAVLSFGMPSSPVAAVPLCSSSPPPCVVSATRNGGPVSDPWDITVTPITGTGSGEFLWNAERPADADNYELGSANIDDVWEITFETGGFLPRVVFTHGRNVTVARSGTQVTVTASPTAVSGECDQGTWPWTCPTTASDALDRDAYLGGHITDYGVWDNAAQRNAFNGMDFNTNIAATSLPPEIENDPSTGAERLLIRLANSHFRSDGTTVFTGFAHLRIPNQFLKKVYGIDDPGSLTGSGLATSIGGSGGGTAVVSQDPGGGAMLVDITGMTFSARKVLIKRGKVTPVKPKNVRAKRRGSTAKLRFDPVSSRGSKIKRYEARCGTGSGVTGKSKKSPVKVKGVPSGKTKCQVRAVSKAGPGRWSKKTKLR